MTNPDELVDAVRDKLKAIPAVVEMVGSADRISSFYESGLTDAVNVMKESTILVAWLQDGSDPGGFNRYCPIVAIFLRIQGSIGLAFTTILNGIATGDALAFTETEFHPSFEVLGGAERLPREQDSDGAEFPNIRMPFRERAA